MDFDATLGGASANSLLTVDEADAFAAVHPFAAAWAGYTNDSKEALLMFATLTFRTRICLLGTKATAEQALPFPRTGLMLDGYALSSAVIPEDVKRAVFELALKLGVSDVTQESQIDLLGIVKAEAGPVKVTFRDSASSVEIPASVRLLIPAAWLCPVTVKTAIFEAV